MNTNILISLILVAGILNTSGTPEKAEVTTRENYLFSSFRGNGDDGLHLAYSHDGLKWIALNNDKSFLKPEVGTRLNDLPLTLILRFPPSYPPSVSNQ